MATKFASNNPFRTPPITPEPTGTVSSEGPSSAASITDSDGTPNTTSSSVQAQPPRNDDSEASLERRSPERQDRMAELAAELDAVSIVESGPSEPPPAYTASANQYVGEATVEFGPRRPFQPAPPPLMTPQSTGIGFGPPPVPVQGGSWSHYPGRRRNEIDSHLLPPPRHPLVPGSVRTGAPRVSSAPQLRPINSDDPRPSRPLSDFAQDFYAAGGDVVAPSEEGDRESVPERERSYAPPSGPPPPPPLSSSSSQYAPPRAPPPPRPADDGKPTSSPTPGRPLLHRGRVLVYPQNYECHKCHNTGYKYFDPTHPCSKCWDRYSKAYSGALAYAPWGTNLGTSLRVEYQRPLPLFRSPSQPSDSEMGLVRGVPPAGSRVVMAGDERIGGRRCWRCGGDGTVSFLIFDIDTCPVCNGIGRVFR